jgi:hypothetical protein
MAFKDALEPRQRVKLEPRQRVKMRGQKSGLLDLRVGAYALTMKIKDDAASEPGQRPVEYCFTDLYELRGTPNAVLAQLSRGVGQLLANIPQQGDSGAWVCCPAPDRPTPGDYAFCGMVVATDFVSGYATFVDGIRGWAAQYPEYDLRLP